MANAFESVVGEFASPGGLSWASADLYDGIGEVVLTLRFNTPTLAAEAYEAISCDLEKDSFRVGPLRLRIPASVGKSKAP